MCHSARAILLPSLLMAAAIAARAGPMGDLSTTDPAGRVSVQTYDASGRLISVTDPHGGQVYPPQNLPRPASSSVKDHTPRGETPLPATTPTTIHVPGDQPTIQAAINAAADGDIVLVADGHYKENINFSGKAIRV